MAAKGTMNAAALISGVTDLLTGDRPAMTNVYKRVIPDFEKHADEALRERSALYWADKIEAPALLLHGTADWRVNARHVLTFAQKLQELNKTYELIVYTHD